MSSVREQILAGIVTALVNNTPANANVFREKETPLARALTPAIVVTPEEEVDKLLGQGFNECTFSANIGIYTRGDPADQLADPVAILVHSLVMTNVTLLGLTRQILKAGSKWEQHEADQTAGVLTMTYTFRYMHPVNDITVTC